MVDVQCGPITLFELLKLLAHRFGLDFKSMVFENGSWTVGVHVRILVNGRHYGTLPEKLDTRVTKEDDICKGVKSALDSCSLRC